MLNRLLELSVRQRALVFFATIVLAGIGVWSAFRLPIDAVPDITNVQVQINTQVPALAPEEIERLVTFPIETEMGGIAGVVELRSLSRFGLSQVTLVFEDGTDIYRARQLVSERLQNALEELPPGLTPKLAPISTGLGEIFYYVVDYETNAPLAADATGLSATNTAAPNRMGAAAPMTREAQLMELKQIHDFIIKPRLRATPGLAEVNASGGYDKQFVVQPDPQKLRSVGLTFSDVARALAENLENAGGSVIQVGGESVAIRAAGRVQSAEEIASLPLKFGSGVAPILVRDVADVAIGKAVRTGAATYNGEEVVLGAALMLAGENSRVVARRVGERLKEIQAKLPPGVAIKPVYDRTVLVEDTLRTVQTNLFEGAVLVVVILFLLLGNWRAAVIVALAIPLSMLFAITGMVQGRVSGNLMSLGAIDFGLIVDGSVVMVENILRHLAERRRALGRGLSLAERVEGVLTSAKEVVNPMFFGVLIITVVYVPILALTGIEGKMFRPMAITVIFALVGSLAIALTLMPALCVAWLSKGEKGEGREGKAEAPATAPSALPPHTPGCDAEDTWLVRTTKVLYRPVLALALRFRRVVVVVAVGVCALAAAIYPRLGAEFVPQLDEGSFATHFIRVTSIGLDASLEMQKRGEKVLLEKFPEVLYTFARLGTAEIATDPMGVNVADTYMMLRPRSEWRKVNGRRITKDQLADLMTRELGLHIPGEAHLFSQPIEMRFNEILEGTRADLAVKIVGDDFDVMRELGTRAKEMLEKIPGAADVQFDALGKTPLLEIIPRRDVMSRYNLHAAEINAVVHHALAGLELGTIIEGNRRSPVVVRLAEPTRNRVDELQRLPVRVGEAGLLPLGNVAELRMGETVAAITREYGQRRAAVLVNLRGRDTDSFVREAEHTLAAGLELPPGYALEFGGQFRNLIEAKRRLMVVVPVALALILTLIWFTFRSVRQTLLISLCVPLAMTGGVFALWLRGLPFSISAAVGFIALSGIAVLNGLMIVTFFNQLRERGADLRAAVWDGSLLRLRPKLMTALVASLGFVPMAIATGAGAEVQRPLATVVIGGILSSTFLTLVLLPTLYEWLETRCSTANGRPLQPHNPQIR
ncbi:MAG TPA: efflux RND transporter permease subunit [Methylomirabilota bacterium]|nr:efflux RND transporter permease subunit [Methylomirabilota bacterium]